MARGAVLAFGVDVGSTNTKLAAVRIDHAGITELAASAAPTPVDAPALLAILDQGIAALTAALGPPDVVGIASMAESGVALGEDGVPLTPVVRWDGSVDPAALDDALDGDDPERLYALTGISASPKVPLVLWAQLRRSRPGMRVRSWLGMADLVAFALTGRAVTDHTLALRTMAVRRPVALPLGSLAFDPALLARVGLTPAQLPGIAAPDDWRAAAVTAVGAPGGLRPGTPVVVAGHDHLVAAWGCGAREAGAIVDSFGTSEALVGLLSGTVVPVGASADGMSAGVDVTGRFTTLISGSASAGRAIAEVAARSGIPLADLGADLDATSVDPRPADGIVLPYLAGRQSPAPDPTARLRVVGGETGGPADADWSRQLAGTLDGVALHAAWARRVLDDVCGNTSPGRDIVVACGPVARRPALLLRKAASFGCAVRTPEVDEPVACSAAMLAAHRALGTPPHVLPLGPPVRATPSAEAAYAAALERFLAAASRSGAAEPERTA